MCVKIKNIICTKLRVKSIILVILYRVYEFELNVNSNDLSKEFWYNTRTHVHIVILLLLLYIMSCFKFLCTLVLDIWNEVRSLKIGIRTHARSIIRRVIHKPSFFVNCRFNIRIFSCSSCVLIVSELRTSCIPANQVVFIFSRRHDLICFKILVPIAYSDVRANYRNRYPQYARGSNGQYNPE